VTTTADSHHLRDYERDGFTIFRDVIDSELVSRASDHVEWLLAGNPEVRGEGLEMQALPQDPFWVSLVSDPRLLDIAERFLGPDIGLFASHYFCKPAHTGQAVLWHQDAAYWPLEPMDVITLWLAIDDSTPENGCVRVVPGSHREQVHELRARDDVDNVLGSEAAATVDEADAVDLSLRAGDVEVHHPNILHASNANTSPHRRCGLTIRYIPTSTKILLPSWPTAYHLRGERGANEWRTPPAFDPSLHFAG